MTSSRATRIIDAHLHLWELGDGGYDWVTPDAGVLYRSFAPADVEPDVVEAGVTGVVLVQADNTVSDTAAMLRVADSRDWVIGVVGWVDLEHPEVARRQLDEFGRHSAFRGVRHIFHRGSPDNFFESPSVLESLGELSRRGLTLDVVDSRPGQLGSIARVAVSMPSLTIVVDHLGNPPLGTDDMGAWMDDLALVARHENVVGKVSGLRWGDFDYSAHALRPVWELALRLFTPQRLMWGSDWPMNFGEGGFAPTFAVLRQLIDTLSEPERARVLGGTADAIYSLTN